jgi:FAD/FMN-containing dehydrogenase
MVIGAGAIAIHRAIARSRARKRQSVCSERYSPGACAALHEIKVERIAAQLLAHSGSRPVSLRKKAPPHQVPKKGDLRRYDDKIDVSQLTQIIDIDPVNRTCVAESGVSFVDLVEATLRHGLAPIVVPELKTITVGGAVSGCSIESMSFKYGGFHDTCLEYEVITAKGEVITCTPDGPEPLLFQMMHGSFGTLGILSKLKFRLVPAKKYVHVKYEKYAAFPEYRAAILRHFKNQDVDFMDGIIHSPHEYVLSAGHFVDHAPYSHAYDWTRVYYRSTSARKEDYLKTADYFFRYDQGVTNVTPESFVGRLLVGKLTHSSNVLRAAEKLDFLLKKEQPTLTLDVFVPISKAQEFLEWYGREFRHFPLWCVPYKRVRDYEWLNTNFYKDMKDELFLDLAIYGMKQKDGKNYHKIMEDKLRELGGVKTLIAHNYYTPEEFWLTWNRKNYETVKAITDPDNLFRDLYTKTCKAAMGAV